MTDVYATISRGPLGRALSRKKPPPPPVGPQLLSMKKAVRAAARWHWSHTSDPDEWPAVHIYPRGSGVRGGRRRVILGYDSELFGFMAVVKLWFQYDATPTRIVDRRLRKQLWPAEKWL